jgi:hypothetical protein
MLKKLQISGLLFRSDYLPDGREISWQRKSDKADG